MLPVPWSQVESWNCSGCGLCCKGYEVVLDFPEWLSIVRNFGVDYTQPGVTKLFLRHKSDDSCVFLHNQYGNWLCSLQHMKPMACKLWPFKISNKPLYGRPSQATYHLGDSKLYVYVDSACPGLRWGNPKVEFLNFVLPEFVDLAIGKRRKQSYTTSQLFSIPTWKLV